MNNIYTTILKPSHLPLSLFSSADTFILHFSRKCPYVPALSAEHNESHSRKGLLPVQSAICLCCCSPCLLFPQRHSYIILLIINMLSLYFIWLDLCFFMTLPLKKVSWFHSPLIHNYILYSPPHPTSEQSQIPHFSSHLSTLFKLAIFTSPHWDVLW